MKELKPQDLQLDDIQAIALKGYGRHPEAYYIFLEVEHHKKAIQWLGDNISNIRDTKSHKRYAELEDENKGVYEECMNLAFTKPGLEALKLDPSTFSSFSDGIQNGMTTPHRQYILGDHGNSAPENWNWGHEYKVKGKDEPIGTIHIMLMLFAKGETELKAMHKRYQSSFEQGGLKQLLVLDGTTLKDRKEHFGYRDGISQPIINGTGDENSSNIDNTVRAGEVILGYKNEYNKYPDSPKIAKKKVNLSENYFDEHPLSDSDYDLGKNGSYLVFRQLEQDVKAFWEFMDKNAKKEDTPDQVEDPKVYLASKMVGRWPEGTPMVKCPFHNTKEINDDDSFGYQNQGENFDKDATRCPLGSHLRRTNPRDGFVDDPKKSIKLTKRHRIIRRGRPYGVPITDSMDPEKILASNEKDGERKRGLQFIGFNSDFHRQFEFIQQTWINNQKFRGLYDDPDPIMGDPDIFQEKDEFGNPTNRKGNFTEQREPVRRVIKEVPRFVHVVGGAYFFLPGIRVIKYLADINRLNSVDTK